MPDDNSGFDELREYTEQLQETHAAMCDPIWDEIGRCEKWDFDTFPDHLRAMCRRYGLDPDEYPSVTECLEALKLAVKQAFE